MIARLGLVLLALGAPIAAQKRDVPRNDPSNCRWCGGDPERMAAAGVFSHGGFPFAATDTAQVDQLLGGKDIYWIETAHFELGLALAPYKVGTNESKKIRAELTEIAEALPDVDPKTRVLDPFLRTHLYALRVEKLWKRFLDIVRKTEADFPDGMSVWLQGTPYRGEGPYVGQKGKFELIVLPTAADQVTLLKTHFGLTIERTQRWNALERDSLIVVTNLMENDLSDDERIHGHVVFNLTHNLIDGFKHYSYDTPRWLNEGLGHFTERELNPRFNTYDASEGSVGMKVNKSNWDAEVRELVAAGKAPRVAELSALRTFAEFTLAHHYACWSMTKFMIATNPDGYGCLQEKLHGLKGADGLPDASNLPDRQRDAFRECFGMTYAQFDEAWQAWALLQQ